MINLENPVRAVALTTISVVAGLGINAALQKAVEKTAPQLLNTSATEADETKVLVKEMLKIVGVSVAIAIVAGLASSAIVNAVDDTFWPTDIDVEIDPTIE
jgi:hypothetical protein